MSEEEIKCLNNCGFANVTQLLLAYVSLQQENSQLRDNWNKLKEFIKKSLEAIDTIQKLIGNAIEDYNPRILTYKQIKDKMLELEKGEEQ